MNSSRFMWCWIFAILCSQFAAAQDLIPTDSELRAAYCIPVLKWQIQMERSALADYLEAAKVATTPEFRQSVSTLTDNMQRGIAEHESTLNRFQSYLLPRMQHLDPLPLLLANNRGEADRKQVMTVIDQCQHQCGISIAMQTSPESEKQKECNTICLATDKALSDRLKKCQDASWLPF